MLRKRGVQLTHDLDQLAVYAESSSYSKLLIISDLSFGRLMDDIVVPYQQNESFFIDGVSLKRDELMSDI